MSVMWISPHTTIPPGATAASAAGTSSPAGANRIAASSSSGGRSSEPPAHSAPTSRANAETDLAGGRHARLHVDLRDRKAGRVEHQRTHHVGRADPFTEPGNAMRSGRWSGAPAPSSTRTRPTVHAAKDLTEGLGLSLCDASELLGLSYQRIQQLVSK